MPRTVHNLPRLFFIRFLPPTLCCLLLAGFFLETRWSDHLAELSRAEQITLSPGSREIERVIKRRVSELLQISRFSSFQTFLDNPTAANRSAATKDLRNFSLSSKLYDQIRYLDLTGQEIIRINLHALDAIPVPDHQLQNKADRYYFSEAVSLHKNQIYLSELDLNIEHGRVETPHKPVIRLATPVFDSAGVKQGVLVMNYLGDDLLQRIAVSEAHSQSHHYLLNADGFWLNAPNPSLTWGFMLNRPDLTMAKQYPAAWQRIRFTEMGQFRDNDGLWSFTTATPLNYVVHHNSLDKVTLKLVSFIPNDQLQADFIKFLKPVLLASGLTLLLIALGAWLLARAQQWRLYRERESLQDRKRLQALAELFSAENITGQSIFDQALNTVVDLTESRIGYIYFYDEETRLFTLHAWSHEVMDNCSVVTPQSTYELDKTGIWGEAVRQRKPILVNDFTAPNPFKKGLPDGHVPLTRFLTVPVIDNKRVVAVVGVGNKQTPYDQIDTDQLVLYMQGVWQITLRRQAEQTNLEQLRKIDLLLNSTLEGIYAVDLQGNCTMANYSCARMLGYPGANELLGKNLHQLIHHSYPDGTPYPALACRAHQAVETGTVYTIDDEVFWRQDGTPLPIAYTSRPIRDGGAIIGMVCTFTDIREQIQHKQEQARLMTVLEESLNEIYLFETENFTFEFANRAALLNLGYSLDELSRLTAFAIKPKFTEETFRQMVKPLLEGTQQRLDFQTIHQRKDGSVYPVEVHLQLIWSGGHASFLAIIFDISDRLEIENQLRHAQKMEAIGQLASGIAHDFNNILQVISGNAQLLQFSDMGNDASMSHHLGEIIKAVTRGSGLTRSMLAFARKQNLTMQPLELNQLVQETEQLAGRLMDKHQVLRLSLYSGPLPVQADASLLQQVLFNLLTNARDAMPDGGDVTISTDLHELTREEVEQLGFGSLGVYALLKVSDTGHGISDEIRQRIYEPFFTTKGVGKGTGLGLAMVFGTIKQHNGFITLDSEPGAGTTFTIYLPSRDVTETTPFINDEASLDEDLFGNGETILVVDDQRDVCASLSQFLERCGYRALSAGSGQDALNLFKTVPDINLVVLDAVMPQMDGLQTMEELRRLRPCLPTLIITGYGPALLLSRRYTGPCLFKPVHPQDLLTQIRSLLTDSPPDAKGSTNGPHITD